MADTQCAVKVKSPVSINIMVCPPGCSTLLGISTIYSLHRGSADRLKSATNLHVIECHTYMHPTTSRASNDISAKTDGRRERQRGQDRERRGMFMNDRNEVFLPVSCTGCHMAD